MHYGIQNDGMHLANSAHLSNNNATSVVENKHSRYYRLAQRSTQACPVFCGTNRTVNPINLCYLPQVLARLILFCEQFAVQPQSRRVSLSPSLVPEQSKLLYNFTAILNSDIWEASISSFKRHYTSSLRAVPVFMTEE